MLEKYCDILVIGTELPGLVTAAFLARRGLSVQVIDSDIFSDHQKLPDPICLTNKHSKLLRSILGRLNVPEMTIQNFLNQESTLQVIFPKNRIDILNNPLTYFEEIEREFFPFYQKIKSFYENQAKLRHQTDVSELFQQLLPANWKERRSFNKFINDQGLNDKNPDYKKLLDLDPQLDKYLKAQLLLAYQFICDNPFSFQISELFNPGDGEIFSVHSGMHTLKMMLKDRITHYDGGIRSKVQINSLHFRNGVFEGAALDESHGSVLSKYIIWNTHIDKLSSLLPKKWRFRKLRKLDNQYQYDYHWFTVRYSVNRDYIPDQMKNNLVIIDDENKELIGDNFLYVQISKAKLDTKAYMDVNFLLPPSAFKEESDFFSTYFQSIQDKLCKLMPFCDKSLKQEFPVENPKQPSDTLFPLNENDFEIFKHGARIHGIITQNEKTFINLFKLHYKTPTPNLYISHPLIFSGFGLESKLILGLKITDLIWQEVEKLKKRAMKTERRIA